MTLDTNSLLGEMFNLTPSNSLIVLYEMLKICEMTCDLSIGYIVCCTTRIHHTW